MHIFAKLKKLKENIMQYIDLHTHTCASDGSDTPSELVKKAAKLGLCAIAVTDHDTLSGLDEATEQGKISNIEVIRGCELSVDSECGEIHILGLWVAKHAPELQQAFEMLQAYRSKRNKIIVDRLKTMGLDIDYEYVLSIAGGDAVGRPHIAAALMKKGYVASVRDAFATYLGSHGKAYEPKKTLNVHEAMRLLNASGASICLAHPGLINCTEAWLSDLVHKLKDLGLSSIEVYHSSHTDAVQSMCLKLAKKYDLDISGGSDYHGSAKPQIHLGVGKGNLRIGIDILNTLKQSRINKGLAI